MASRTALRLVKEARGNDALAQLALGRLYLCGGEGLAANPEAALHWLVRSAQAGVADAAELVAEQIAQDGAGPQLEQYLDLCRAAAERGSAAAHCALGNIYASRPDAAAAEAAYRVAAQAGHLAAARKLGLLLARQAGANHDEARHWLQTAAAAGDAPAAQALADLLWRAGDPMAARWLEAEAETGDAQAMYRLGEILCAQTDAEQAVRGAHWLERAARKGHGRALWRYGRMHVSGFSSAPAGLPHSLLQASRLLERAAAAGVSEALWDLARIYEMSGFSRRDLGRARECLEQAAAAGVDDAELELGKRLARYKGDRQAWIAAGLWLSRAAEKGSLEARETLERIAERAPAWPDEIVGRQEEVLAGLRPTQPVVAARLELAACFGLSPRETLFIDPREADRAWCLEVDLGAHFKQKPWRLVIMDSAAQRLALERAGEAFRTAGSSGPDLTGRSSRARARHLEAMLSRLSVEPSLFVRSWKLQQENAGAPPRSAATVA